MRIFERTYGVEIECMAPTGMTQTQAATHVSAAGVPTMADGYNHVVPIGSWRIRPDGSLRDYTRGMEFVSPPMKGEEGFATIAKVCATLQAKGFSVNRHCGLHVHIDVRRPTPLNLDAMKRLIMLYAENEANCLDPAMPPSRRGSASGWCRSIAAHANPTSLANAQDTNQLADILYYGRVQRQTRHRPRGRDGRRFVKLNVTSSWLYGTAEFRQAAGTIDATKICQWIIFCLRMIDAAQHSETANVLAQATRTIAMVRRGTKRAIVYDMLTRPEGCTQAEVLNATGWKAITLVGLARQFGLTIRTENDRHPITHHRVMRYFGTRDGFVQQVAAPAPRPRPRNIEELADLIGMTSDEKEFWKRRTEFFAGATGGTS